MPIITLQDIQDASGQMIHTGPDVPVREYAQLGAELGLAAFTVSQWFVPITNPRLPMPVGYAGYALDELPDAALRRWVLCALFSGSDLVDHQPGATTHTAQRHFYNLADATAYVYEVLQGNGPDYLLALMIAAQVHYTGDPEAPWRVVFEVLDESDPDRVPGITTPVKYHVRGH